MKFKIGANCDYVQGHLRYGHKETEVEFDSKEELEKKLKDPESARELFEDVDLIVDDYEVDDYECDYTDCYILESNSCNSECNHEHKHGEMNIDNAIYLLKEARYKFNSPLSDSVNALNFAIDILQKLKDDDYNYEYGEILLKELRSKLDGPEPSDMTNAVDKAIELFNNREVK